MPTGEETVCKNLEVGNDNTCFTSDFLLKDADPWREDCWLMMKRRSDLWFYFFTKRIDRFMECVPEDWGDGYDNVLVGCTVENQEMADYRLPIFKQCAQLSQAHKANIDFRIGKYMVPEKVKFEWKEEDYHD